MFFMCCGFCMLELDVVKSRSVLLNIAFLNITLVGGFDSALECSWALARGAHSTCRIVREESWE